jgi:hypothetical protein
MEEWKNYNENYSCSNLGRFKNNKTQRILKPWYTGNKNYSYLKIGLGKDRHRRRCHIVVAELFCIKPITTEKLEIDHINTERFDNRACNLQWITHRDNCLKKRIHQ